MTATRTPRHDYSNFPPFLELEIRSMLYHLLCAQPAERTTAAPVHRLPTYDDAIHTPPKVTQRKPIDEFWKKRKLSILINQIDSPSFISTPTVRRTPKIENPERSSFQKTHYQVGYLILTKGASTPDKEVISTRTG